MYDQAVCAAAPSASEELLFCEQIRGLIPLADAIGRYSPIFLAFFRQFEALNAKLILAKVFGLHTVEQWYDIGPYTLLPRSLMTETPPLQEILALLEGTYLSDLQEVASNYEQMESVVDFCALRDMYQASSMLKPEAKADFQLIMRKRIAVTSLILSLRLKKIYQWDDDKVRPFLEKFHEVFDIKVWPQIKIAGGALDTYIEQSRTAGGQEPDLIDMEYYLERYYYTWVSSMFHRDFHAVYCVVAYLWLLFYQIRNLFKIIEGKRFGLFPEQILNRIICNS